MILDNAWRVGCARGKLARIDALIVTTRQARWTASVTQTYRYRWLAVSHANAYGLMILHLTRLILGTNWGAAQRHDARVATLAIRAGHVRGTVIIAIAFPFIRCTGQLSILIDYKARLAYANGLMTASFALFVALTNE